jgi:hypothetical protein
MISSLIFFVVEILILVNGHDNLIWVSVALLLRCLLILDLWGMISGSGFFVVEISILVNGHEKLIRVSGALLLLRCLSWIYGA